MGRGARKNFFRGGGKRRIHYLLDQIKPYSCNQSFARGLVPKVNRSCSKHVPIGRHVEQTDAVQVYYEQGSRG